MLEEKVIRNFGYFHNTMTAHLDQTKSNDEALQATASKTVTIDIATLTTLIANTIEEQKKGKKEMKEKGDATGAGAGDPKAHMANERTFLKWVRMLLLLFIFGTILLLSGNIKGFKQVGITLIAFAVVGMPYSMYRYWMRQGMLERKEKGGADKTGVYIFALAIATMLIVALVDAVRQSNGKTTMLRGAPGTYGMDKTLASAI